MTRQRLVLYVALFTALISVDTLFIWQFDIGVSALTILLIKDFIVILAVRKIH